MSISSPKELEKLQRLALAHSKTHLIPAAVTRALRESGCNPEDSEYRRILTIYLRRKESAEKKKKEVRRN